MTDDDLKRIDGAMSAFGGPVSYEVHCSDGLTRELSLKELLSYENPQRKAIHSLKATSVSLEGDNKRTAIVDFEDRYQRTIAFYLNGFENDVEKFNSAMMDIVEGMRPWYAWFVGRFSAPMFAMVFGLVLGVLAVVLIWHLSACHDLPGAGTGAAWVVLMANSVWLGSLFLSFMCAETIDNLKKRFFPAITFAIGQGAKRHDTMENIRWVIVVGSALAIVSGIVVSIIMMPFSR
ncbi:MAG TPA: hypothetical protein DD670_13765 [Planctomycetaceae bacterium]|nr:hypothetical protein [Planctomycetaceae bacterium]